MIGVLVTFTQTGKFDRSALEEIAAELRGPFEGMAGLRFKSFMLDEDGARARNFYVWDDEEKARAFFTEEIVDKVTGIYGAPPHIEYLDVVGFVDNSGT
ncbi:antibiotic biosynthesis monooxygenase family protein [Streptomyces nojiriensis]|uniref:antibiotic biosynthesis monooxygenase family protein n=1 Tax=Streptomyces nojiriensis TaxID=66374 RepID=UPI0035DA4FEE